MGRVRNIRGVNKTLKAGKNLLNQINESRENFEQWWQNMRGLTISPPPPTDLQRLNQMCTLYALQREVRSYSNITPNLPGIEPEKYIRVTGKFNDDYRGKSTFAHHEGFDWKTVDGTKIIVLYKSTVAHVRNEDLSAYGKYIILQDINNSQLFYLGAHLSSIAKIIDENLDEKGERIGERYLREGDILDVNDTAGFSGSTGKGGPHFHTGTYIVPTGKYADFRNSDDTFNNYQAVDPYNHTVRWKGPNWIGEN